jgi:hypothetical protein
MYAAAAPARGVQVWPESGGAHHMRCQARMQKPSALAGSPNLKLSRAASTPTAGQSTRRNDSHRSDLDRPCRATRSDHTGCR